MLNIARSEKIPAEGFAGEMSEESSFQKALRVFSRSHYNTARSLRDAISVFVSEESKRKISNGNNSNLEIGIADTNDGAGMALFITGFKNISEIERFLLERLNVSSK